MDAARRVLLTDLLSVVALSMVGFSSWQLANGDFPGWTAVGVGLAVVGTIGTLYALEHDPVASVVDRTSEWQLAATIVGGLVGLWAIAAFGFGLEIDGIMATNAGIGVGIVAYRLRYGVIGPIPPARLARETENADS